MENEIIDNNDNKLVIKDSEGNIHNCIKLFTFDSDETKLSYICYTEEEKDDKGNTLVYAGTYDPSGEDNHIVPIKSDEEWNLIKDTLEEIIKATKKVENKNAE